MQVLSVDQAKAILCDILRAINDAENSPNSRLRESLSATGNDMVKRMQYVYPALIQIEMDELMKHGYVGDCEGLVKFTQEVITLEKDNPEIRQLNGQLRDILIPPLPDLSSR